MHSSDHLRALALSSSTSLLICAALLRLASSSLQGPKGSIRQHLLGHPREATTWSPTHGEHTALLVRRPAVLVISADPPATERCNWTNSWRVRAHPLRPDR